MHSLPKQERLSGRTRIQNLFKKGRRIKSDGFTMIWLYRIESPEIPVRLGISVSKKISKKAVFRNRLKRQIREVYRTNKSFLFEHFQEKEQKVDFFLLYHGDAITDTDSIKDKIILILNRLKSLDDQNSRSIDHRTH